MSASAASRSCWRTASTSRSWSPTPTIRARRIGSTRWPRPPPTMGSLPITPADPNATEHRGAGRGAARPTSCSRSTTGDAGGAAAGLAERGALNLHGSLLPKFRGRAPVNWAVLRASAKPAQRLHYMSTKPDNGDIVGATAVPILPDDTAREVFDKVTVAAEMTLDRALPALIAGNAPRRPQDLAQGSYFGGRGPEDGVIDWTRDAQAIHNLVRAVAPPYPGAFTAVGGVRARLLRTRIADGSVAADVRAHDRRAGGNALVAHCGGGGLLHVLSLELDGVPIAPGLSRSASGTPPLRSVKECMRERESPLADARPPRPREEPHRGARRRHLRSGDDAARARHQVARQSHDRHDGRTRRVPRDTRAQLRDVCDQLHRARDLLDRAPHPVPLHAPCRPPPPVDQHGVPAAGDVRPVLDRPARRSWPPGPSGRRLRPESHHARRAACAAAPLPAARIRRWRRPTSRPHGRAHVSEIRLYALFRWRRWRCRSSARASACTSTCSSPSPLSSPAVSIACCTRGTGSGTTTSFPKTHEKNPDPRHQRLHRPSPVAPHPRHDGLGRLRDGHADGPHRRPDARETLPFLRRRHHDQQGVDRVPHQEVRHRPAAGRDRHAGDLRARAAARVRARFRGESADRPRLRAVREAHRVPVDVRGLRHVPRRRVRPGALRARARADQQAALDLRLRRSS